MKILPKILLIAALCSFMVAAEKQLKSGESEVYNDVVKDLDGSNFVKALTDLDKWRMKYSDSDFQNERSALYIQSYAGVNQPEKVLAAAGELLSKDLNATFAGSGVQPAAVQATIIRVLYNAAWAISKIPNPTLAELATGEKAARQLMAYDTPLLDLPAEKWAELRNDMRAKAQTALLYISMLPGIQAMAKQPPDCSAAEMAYAKALGTYPDNAALSYELGRALNCEAKTIPEKQSPAIYEFVRAATIDPTLGDSGNDKKKIQSFADNAYVRLHGSDEGLDQLKQQVRQFPLPPADFSIRTAADIAGAKQAQFEKDHPELALWMKIRAMLADSNGEQYFESQLKDSTVPQLTGTLIETKPACHPKELLVAVAQPGAQQPQSAEIMLKLDKALPGAPDLNTEVHWEAVPSAFTKEPFLLTMDAETSKIEGLKMNPCVAAPTKKSGSATRK